MKRYITIFSWIVLFLMFYPANGQCLSVDLRGHLASLYILRDTSGFQNTFLDDLRGIQWRNEIQFDLTLKPDYVPGRTIFLDKVFMSYTGAYDAIYALTDRYDDVRKKSPDDFELGNDDLEWENNLREIFVDIGFEQGMQTANLRLGRQIVRWGETDSFNVINVANPSNNSFQMFFSDPDDTAIALWMARLNYNVTGAGPFDNFGIEMIAIPEIRPTQLAPLGNDGGYLNIDSPYAFIMTGLYDNLDAFGLVPTTKLTEDVPANTWDNMEYGISLFFSISGLEAALHYFVGFQDDGVIDWSNYFTAPSDNPISFQHPRQQTYGYSFNYFVAPLNGVIRGEGAYTDKMHLGGPPDAVGFPTIAPKTAIQNLLGFDKDLHPKWIGTTSALTSGFEAYWKHFKNLGTERDEARYAADKMDTYVLTAFFMTDYHHGQIKPMLRGGYDTQGVFMTWATLAYDYDGKWLFSITQMSFWGNRTPWSKYSLDGVMQDNSELSFRVAYRF